MTSIYKFIFGLIIAVAFCTQSYAEKYEVTISAELVKDSSSFVLFGITDTVTPFSFSFTIDTALAPITTVPAGTTLNTFLGSSSPVDLQTISANAISNLNLNLGTASWNEFNLVLQGLSDSGFTYDFLVVGELVNGKLPEGTVTSRLVLNDAQQSFLLRLGTFTCDSTTCINLNSGNAFSSNEGGFGAVTNIQTNIELLDKSAQEKIADIIARVNRLNIQPKLKQRLLKPLGDALGKLSEDEDIDTQGAITKMQNFIKKVSLAVKSGNIKPIKGKRLIKRAEDVISQLQSP